MKDMGDGRRIARVEREIQATVAQYLIRSMRSELPGIVSVASVKMPGDLRTAKVYISVIGSEDERKEVLKILTARAYEVQNFIGSELKMRYCPKLTFFTDYATDEIVKVDRILAELELERRAKAKAEAQLANPSATETDSETDDE